MKETELRPVAVFNSAVKEYQSKPHTPELVTRTYQAIWLERGKFVGMVFEVCPCPYVQEELTGLEEKGKRVGYLPPQLATQQSRYLLAKMFPKIRNESVRKNNPVTNDENPFGWFDYEAGIDLPYLNTTEKELTEKVVEEGRKLLSLNQYIIAGRDSKLLTGQYLDTGQYLAEKGTWTSTRLGSRFEGRVVKARFYRDGYLDVDWDLKSDDHDRALGGRSSGVKKA